MWFRAFAARVLGRRPPLKTEPTRSEPSLTSTEPLEPPPQAPGPEPRELKPGQVLAGRFRVLSFLARGGMGEVYAAEDLRGGGRVALKTIRAEGASSLEMLERFRREVENAKRVTSPHVCRINDIHYHDPGRHPEYLAREPAHPVVFLTMELLEGETLSQAIRRNGRILPSDALPMFRQIVAGLEAAHRAGIIHRDLKSSNIILVPTQEHESGLVVKITDFGLAHRLPREQPESSLTEIGKFVGTPEYMAPEVRGQLQPATVESDIYSLGVVMYQALTGGLPIPSGDGSGATPPPPSALAPGIPRSWDGTILRCLEKIPAKRFHTASEALRSIESSGRKRMAVWAALALCAVGFAVYLWPKHSHASTNSVAVFGFKNLTGDPSLDDISSALQYALSNELRVAGDIPVVPGEYVDHVRLNLGLKDVESYGRETLKAIRANTGANLVVLGSYLAAHQPDGTRKLTLYVTTEETGSGTQKSLSEDGSAEDIKTLVSRSVSDLRAQWNLSARSPEQQQAAGSAIPTSSEALRLYSEGMRKSHTFDLPGALKLFEKAVAIEPSYAPAHAEMAEVLEDLGRDKEARAEAKRALDLSKSLPREQRLLIEGEYYDVMEQWDQAIEAFQTLFNWAPDNLYYGLLLASVQTGDQARRTIGRLRSLPSPLRDDPRIDMREAKVESTFSNYAAERRLAAEAAAKARRLGAWGQVAEAEDLQAQAETMLGNHERAKQLYQDAERISNSLDDEISAAADRRALGMLKFDDGDLSGAASDVNKALEIARRRGSYVAEARGVSALGAIRLAQGHLEEASTLFERSLHLWRDASNELNTGVDELNLGIALHQRGLADEAEKHLRESISSLQNTGPRFRAHALAELASIEMDKRNFNEAEKLLHQAFEIEHDLKETAALPKILIIAGKLARVTGALDESKSQYSKALDLASGSGQAGVAALARLGLAQVELDRKKYDVAETQARQALAEFEREGRTIDVAYARAVTALCVAGRGDKSSAARVLAPAIQALPSLEDPDARKFVRAAQARIIRGRVAR